MLKNNKKFLKLRETKSKKFLKLHVALYLKMLKQVQHDYLFVGYRYIIKIFKQLFLCQNNFISGIPWVDYRIFNVTV